MAKSLFPLGIGVLLLAGCQQQPATVTPISKPNLDGPAVAAAPAVRMATPTTRPVATAAASTPTAPPIVRRPGVPQDWIPVAPANTWRWIVIHHSATPTGSAAIFDREHKSKGWDELGYHFVVGNGTFTRDGQIEVGPRWPKQKWGAHAKTPDEQFNNYGIGICLVGNFDMDRPSPAQMQAVAKLTAYLMQTYHIPASHVIGHCDTKPTDCPGRHVSVVEIRRLASQIAQDIGKSDSMPIPAVSMEMLRPAPAP